MIRWVLCALLLAGCSARGPVDSAVEQRIVWFSYVAGEDIRASCETGAPARLRFVNNADFNNEVRTIDVQERTGGATLTSRRFHGSGIVVLAASLLNQPTAGEKWLRHQEFNDLKATAAADGALGPPRAVTLRSHEYYAIAAACADGVFTVRGYGGKELENLHLFNMLENFDPILAAWPAVDPGMRRPPSVADIRSDHEPYFVIRFDPEGHTAVTGS